MRHARIREGTAHYARPSQFIGLKRRGFPEITVRALKRAYRALFLSGKPLEAAVARAREAAGDTPEVTQLIAFVEGSARGVCRP